MRVSGRLSPDDDKTLRGFEVDIPDGTAALRLELVFDPVYSLDVERNRGRVRTAIVEYLGERAQREPALVERQLARVEFAATIKRLRNHINFNLYDPEWRFRGRWDFTTRGGPSWLGEIDSSPGFVDGTLPPGRWHLVLEAHQISTARCDFALSVEPQPEPPPPEQRARDSSDAIEITGVALVPPRAGWLRGELHSHSSHSDGRHSVAQLAGRARAAGLDFIALTDHNTTSGHAEALARDDVLFIPGEELTTFDGHFCLYGVERTIPWHARGQRRSIAEVADEVRAQGALFSLAHPYQIGAPVCAGCRWPGQDPPPDRLDLLEIWSGCYTDRGVEIERAIRLWDRIWDQGLRPTGVAARDWHGRAQIDSGERRFARTVVRAREETRTAVLEGLRAGAVYLSAGPHLELSLTRGEARAGIGEALTGTGPATLHARLSGALPATSELRLVHDGRQADARAVDNRGGTQVFDVSAAGRYRVELRAPEGEPLLISNHVLLG